MDYIKRKDITGLHDGHGHRSYEHIAYFVVSSM